ncbi:MAG: potassium transporter KefC [Gammaproteobacteria bacterium]|nr:potassium transporter KefC [Gammaproteobacteria bacterium]
MSHLYLLDVVILLVTAVFVVPFSQWVRLGAVPGFLIAGGIVGPSGLGLINNITEISHFAEIGVVLLLFVIGIELRPARLWQMRRLVFGLGSLQVLVTGLLLVIITHLLFEIPIRVSILVSLALALSSTAFVLQLLKEYKCLNSVYGRTSFAILLLQDLAVVPLFALVPLLAMTELSVGTEVGLAVVESLLILALVFGGGRYLLHPILHRVALSKNSEIFTALVVLIVLGTAFLTEQMGLSMAMGAFLAGLLISESSYKHQVIAEIQPFRGLLLGLFFMSMGMSLNLGLLLETPLLSLGLTALLISVKVVTLYPLARYYGLRSNHSAAVSLILAQSGEFALVLFSLAYQAELLNSGLFEQLLLVVLLSMLATPLLAYLAQRLAKRPQPVCVECDPVEPPVAAPLILVGFGRVGHRVGEILQQAGHPFVALDSRARVVERERKKGHPVFYGDARNSVLLQAAGIHKAEAVIVTISQPRSTQELVHYLRESYPEVRLYARSHNLDQCIALRKLGASDVVSENIEASLELARMVLVDAGGEVEVGEEIVAAYRRNYHAQISGEIALNDVESVAKK